jgi:4-hydroxybenzoate polyprenyltransferase
MIRSILFSLRPFQWVKNAFVLAAPLFARELDDLEVLSMCLAAVGLFCLAASGVYLLNDIADRNRDREHPTKRRRPIASGELGVGAAGGLSAVLLAGAVGGGFLLARDFGLLVALYVVIQVAYSLWLRRAVILDVFCIASGFVLRVIAGAAVVGVYLSSWLILTTIFLSLFLALCKRRAEAAALGEEQGAEHRETLEEYTLRFLDELISVTTASVVICYSLYTLDERTIAVFGTRNLVFTVPFVIYGIFRYLFLVHRRSGGGSPASAIAGDLPLAATTLAWAGTVVGILYL